MGNFEPTEIKDREIEVVNASKEMTDEELCYAELEKFLPGITPSVSSQDLRVLLEGNLGFGNNPDTMMTQFTFHTNAYFDFNATRKVLNSTDIILLCNSVVFWRWD